MWIWLITKMKRGFSESAIHDVTLSLSQRSYASLFFNLDCHGPLLTWRHTQVVRTSTLLFSPTIAHTVVALEFRGKFQLKKQDLSFTWSRAALDIPLYDVWRVGDSSLNRPLRWLLYPPPKGAFTSFSRQFNNAILHRNWRAGYRRLCLKQTQGATHVISLSNIQTWYRLEFPHRLLSTENQGICPAPRHPLGVFPPYLITMKYPPSRAVSRARLAAPTSER
jgi:hypothetical protein